MRPGAQHVRGGFRGLGCRVRQVTPLRSRKELTASHGCHLEGGGTGPGRAHRLCFTRGDTVLTVQGQTLQLPPAMGPPELCQKLGGSNKGSAHEPRGPARARPSEGSAGERGACGSFAGSPEAIPTQTLRPRARTCHLQQRVALF